MLRVGTGRRFGGRLVGGNGAVLDLPFSQMTVLPGIVAFSRASTATCFNAAGVLITAAAGVARFDCDPVTLQPRGLLIEPTATNLCKWSAAFSNAAWSKIGTSAASTGTTTAPDGTTMQQITLPAVNASGAAQSIGGQTVGTTVTGSVWLSGSGTCSIQFQDDVNVFAARQVTLSATPTRFSTTGTTGGSAYLNFYAVCRNGGDTATVAQIWGAQAQVGSSTTSYISTTSATATRAADVAAVTVPNGTYDVLIQDKAGGAWTTGAVVSGGAVALSPRSGQTAVARLRMFTAGTLSAATQAAMAVAA